jgi:hypothetical protein
MSSEEAVDWTGTETLERIKTLMITGYESVGPGTRHGPVLVHGSHGTGKSSIISAVYSNCEAWFGRRLFRIVRFSGATPRSAYTLELLRVICQQLCLLLHLSDGFLPKDASFDPLYVNNWFQTLVRRFEESATNDWLVILIDDLHRLNPLDSDIVAALSWLPISLPRNVHVVGTTLLPPESLKLTPVQRERFRSPDCYIELLPNPGECYMTSSEYFFLNSFLSITYLKKHPSDNMVWDPLSGKLGTKGFLDFGIFLFWVP